MWACSHWCKDKSLSISTLHLSHPRHNLNRKSMDLHLYCVSPVKPYHPLRSTKIYIWHICYSVTNHRSSYHSQQIHVHCVVEVSHRYQITVKLDIFIRSLINPLWRNLNLLLFLQVSGLKGWRIEVYQDFLATQDAAVYFDILYTVT